MRIVHFEDEWAKTRSIAHRLHDRIFEYLSPEDQINLNLIEKEEPKKTTPSRIRVDLDGKPPRQIFEYIFVTEIEALRETVTKEDVVVVDIMRSDNNGRFVPMLKEILTVFDKEKFSKDRWRYFSAYPEKVPDGCDLTGFTKRQASELVEFLFNKVCEQESWT